MADETEIKLIVPEEKIEQLINGEFWDCFQPSPWQQQDIKNTYFDTLDRQLRANKVALRIREVDGRFIQTVKSQGLSSGGLQQRQEWEQEISAPKLDWSLLPKATQSLVELDNNEFPVAVFRTDFVRQRRDIKMDNDTLIEVAVDTGTVSHREQEEHISEVELELKKGELEQLFQLSAMLIEQFDATFFSMSKAERGYGLGGALPAVKPNYIVALNDASMVEDAFVKALAIGYDNWLENEKRVIRDQSLVALAQMRRAIQFLLDVLAIYSPVVLRKTSKFIREELNWLLEGLAWVKHYAENKALFTRMEKKDGLYATLPSREIIVKDLKSSCANEKHQNLESTLEILQSRRYQELNLAIMRWLALRQWREELSDKSVVQLNQSIGVYGTKQLNTFWKELKAAFDPKKHLTRVDYFDQIPRLRKALNAGYCFGSFFEPEARRLFRQFWMDIQAGIEEFQEFASVSQASQQLDEEAAKLVEAWLKRQSEGLSLALQSTRQAAVANKPYWRS